MKRDYKNEILKCLKEGKKSTSEISMIISRDYYYTKKFLKELHNNNLIKNISVHRTNYWLIK